MCPGRREEWILTDHWQSLPQSSPSGHPCLALLPFLGHTYPFPRRNSPKSYPVANSKKMHYAQSSPSGPDIDGHLEYPVYNSVEWTE